MRLAKRTPRFAGFVRDIPFVTLAGSAFAGGTSATVIEREVPLMKASSIKKGNGAPAGTITELADAARAAQAAIRNEPATPENYATLAAALRVLAQSLRERNPQGSDRLLHLACAAAWEAKRLSGPGLTSGRTKQEVKILIAWLRTRNHITPEGSESLIDRIHSEHLGQALDGSDLFLDT